MDIVDSFKRNKSALQNDTIKMNNILQRQANLTLKYSSGM